MKLINRSKNVDEKSFIMRLENGYGLVAEYEYGSKGKRCYLDYHLFRRKDEGKYVLEIVEGNAEDAYHDHPSKRDEWHEFETPQEALQFLKEKENFKISDWGHHR